MKRVMTIQHREALDNYLFQGVFLDTFLPKMPVVELWYTSTISETSVYYWYCSFTGKEKDPETGYGYFGARYMDHELMTMWLSVDPLADKYPSISPYAYCAWNPVKLVDPDGNEAIDNDDWYINSKGEMRWFNSTAETYTYEGEEYTRYGQTASMTNSDGEFVYGDQYGNTHSSKPLKEVSITETLTDFERTMRNPLVQSVHQSAASFWGNPVTMGAVIGIGSFIGLSELWGLCSQLGALSSAETIVLTEHAAQRAVERGFSTKDIRKIIKKGDLTKGPDRYSNIQSRYTYRNNTVIVNGNGKIVTVYGRGNTGKIHK